MSVVDPVEQVAATVLREKRSRRARLEMEMETVSSSVANKRVALANVLEDAARLEAELAQVRDAAAQMRSAADQHGLEASPA